MVPSNFTHKFCLSWRWKSAWQARNQLKVEPNAVWSGPITTEDDIPNVCCNCAVVFFHLVATTIESLIHGRLVLRWGRGLVPPDSLVAPDSKASWPFWRDFWGPKMLQNPNFLGLRPGSLGELTELHRHTSCSPKNLTHAVGPSGLVSTGLRV